MYFVYVWKGSSSKYIFFKSESSTTSEIHYLEADEPLGNTTVINPREHGMEYHASHRGDFFYIITNDNNAVNFKLCAAPVNNPSKENWVELIPHRPDVRLSGMDVFSKHLVLYERSDGLPHIRVLDANSGSFFATILTV
jgi:oligopeptidase B